jgi:hypothetical protein
MTGNWYESGADIAEGLTFEVLEDGTLAGGHWYTWHNDERNHFVLLGDTTARRWIFDTYQAIPYGTKYAGTGTVTVLDSNTIEMTWKQKHDWLDTDDNSMRWCFYNCDWTKTLTRLTQPIACEL